MSPAAAREINEKSAKHNFKLMKEPNTISKKNSQIHQKSNKLRGAGKLVKQIARCGQLATRAFILSGTCDQLALKINF
jgi:hypothetical protein